MKNNKKEIFLFVILIAIFCIAIAPKIFQNDTFFTIAIGRNIIENGIDNKEVLTWHENLEFTNVRWLFNVIIAVIYNAFDFFGIYLFVILMSVVIGITIFYILLKKKININLAFFMTLLMLYFGQGIIAARAQLVSIWLFILEIYYIEKVLDENKKIDIIILLIIPILIANIHTSLFPLCFIFYLPYFAEFILSKIFKNNDGKIIIESRKNIKILFIIFIISIFTGFCTPLGTAPYTVMIEASKGISTLFIQELQPLVLVDQIVFSIYFIIIFGILGFTKTKFRITDVFLLLGLSLMSISTIRAIFYFVFIGGISLTRIIDSFLKDYDIYDFKISNKTRIVLFTILSVFIITISVKDIVGKINTEYISMEEYPVDACEFIKDNIDTEKMRIYNGFNIGSYLEFKDIPAFMDSRSEIYCEEFNDTTILKDFYELYTTSVHYNEIFEKYEITHVLVKNIENINVFIRYDNLWKCIYQDDSFSLYEKNVK